MVPAAAAKASKSTKSKSEVQLIMAEENHEEYGKRYLIQWSGVDSLGDAWKCTWEKQADMDCDERVADFMMSSWNVQKDGKQQSQLV